jgi:hypothetical protein
MEIASLGGGGAPASNVPKSQLKQMAQVLDSGAQVTVVTGGQVEKLLHYGTLQVTMPQV